MVQAVLSSRQSHTLQTVVSEKMTSPPFFILLLIFLSISVLVYSPDAYASVAGIGNIEKNIRLNTGDFTTASWSVANTNPSNPITVVFSAKGDGAQFVTAPQSVTIPGGDIKDVTFKISIPNDASAGTFVVNVYAVPDGSGQNTGVRSTFNVVISDGTSDSNSQSSQTTTTPESQSNPTSQTSATPKDRDASQQSTTTPRDSDDNTQQTTTTPGGTSQSQTTSTTPKTTPKETPASSSPTTSGSSSGTSSSSGNRGGGGGSASNSPASTADAVYLKEVSWDCKAGLVTIIAGPEVDALSVTVRTSQSGVQQATLSDEKIPGFKKFTTSMDKNEDYIGIKLISMSGRDSAIVNDSINIDSCTGSKQYKLPQKDAETMGTTTKVPPKDMTPSENTNTVKPVIPAPFVDVTKDPQFYIDRYNNEDSYKKWFHENYPEYDDIYHALGMINPSDIPQDKETISDPKPTPEPVEPTCGRGTVMINGMCQVVSEPKDENADGGGCLIATAAFGDELAPQVQQLREIRDSQLMQTSSGESFMVTFNEIYHSFSPYIADYQRQNPAFNELVKIGITPMLSTLSIMEHADDDASVISLGVLVLALNGVMYAGLPVLGMWCVRSCKKSKSVS